MCDAATAFKAGSSMMAASAQRKEERRHYQNTAAAATSSMNNKADQANLKFEEDNRTALQEAYDLALQNRAKEATFFVQAVENGVMGISVNEGFAALQNSSARGSHRFDQERRSREAAHLNHLTGIQAEAANRMNAAAPRTSSRDVLMAGATAGASSASDRGYFDDLKIGG